jgi:hypothetical protein
VTLSPASLSFQADTRDPAPTATIQIVVSNPPAGDFYYHAQAQRTAINTIDANLFTSGQGSISVVFWTPRQLGAGVYNDSIRLRLCADSLCAQVIAETTIPVTFTVTGLPLTSFGVIPITSTLLESKSTDTQAMTFRIQLTVFDIPPQGLYVRFNETPRTGSQRVITNSTFVQTGPVSSTGTGSAEVTLTLAVPTSLQARRYESDLEVFLCFDAACTSTVQGSPIATPLRYLVYASEGREYSRTELAIGAKSAAWDRFSQRLYVMQGFTTGVNSVVAVDPVTGVVGTPVSVPDESSSIVLSDDGQFAYINSTYGGAVYRYRLPGLQADGVIHLDPMRQAYRIAVAPGAPLTLAVAQTGTTVENTIAIYDDLVKRGTEVNPAASIAWGSSAAELYSTHSRGTGLFKWSVTPTGLTLVSTSPFTGGLGMGGQMFFESGLLYSNSGTTYNPLTDAFQRFLDDNCCGNVAIDIPRDRAFRFDGGLKSYTLSTGKELSIVSYPTQLSVSTTGTPPIRWGTNGLTLVTSDGRLIILSGTFVAP